ncbi:hypothetical protein [Halothiobacillus sp. DCM-1]|uniref:hypothetical protein n=1 Tax=Halothiobacillus sp. DCM-1 TaxID=3112558 RepID=UPI00324C21A2
MNTTRKRQIEFGDFQTPPTLAYDICQRLVSLGIKPEIIIEPTCGRGAFVLAAANTFPQAREIFGFEINNSYLDELRSKLASLSNPKQIHLEHADFFATDWQERIKGFNGEILVLGNFPWVTNSVQGSIGGSNLPEKSNFLKFNGFDAISGKANFDISEWMLLDVLRWLKERSGYIAMLVKTAVARKILAHAEKQDSSVMEASLIKIDAKKHFGASVDACLIVVRLGASPKTVNYDYTVFESLEDTHGCRVGHRMGLTVGNLDLFERFSFLIGQSPKKWRSGVKHDASAVMEFTRNGKGLENGIGEVVRLEDNYLFPLLKGSDIGSNKPWREKFVLVTQRYVGESTEQIRTDAPNTWKYLLGHASILDSRRSTIYAKNPRFSVFGVGEYAFKPWRIAICGLYKALRFRLVEPIDGKPVIFDDTVYYLSFDAEAEARKTFDMLNSEAAVSLLSSLIFWDEKRPIKTAILNLLDWSRLDIDSKELHQVEINLTSRSSGLRYRSAAELCR